MTNDTLPRSRTAITTTVLATAVAALLAAPAAAAPEDVLEPCEAPAGALCGALTVYEDRAAGRGRTLDINVVVLPATGDGEPGPPVFPLAGGPGQGAAEMAPMMAMGMEALRHDHDLVLVDQRGTGSSQPLHCEPPADPVGYFGHVFHPERMARCRERLARNADLTLYTTSIAADDLDDVRRWLGYEKIIPSGGSYGTRMAMEYMRRHGEHVAMAILDGVAAFDAFSPLYYAYDAQRALDRLFDGCDADSACDAALPALRADFNRIVDRLRAGPVEVTFSPGGGDETITVPYSLGDFGYTLRGLLYNEVAAFQLPGRIHRAAESGDLSYFARSYYQRAENLSTGLAHGLYLSIICAEDVARVERMSADEIARWTTGTFLGDYLVRDYLAACAGWPRATIDAGYHRPLEVPVPVLVLSGGLDPVTPPRWGEATAEALPNALHLTFPDAGHGATGNFCGQEIAIEFLARGSVENLDISCMETLPKAGYDLLQPPG